MDQETEDKVRNYIEVARDLLAHALKAIDGMGDGDGGGGSGGTPPAGAARDTLREIERKERERRLEDQQRRRDCERVERHRRHIK